jgi:hypothetical protein
LHARDESQPGRPGKPAARASRKRHVRLILILAVLVGVIVGGTLGILAFSKKGTSSAGNSTTTSTAGKIVGVVSFTASGGLQGAYTIRLPDAATPASSIQKGATANVLEVVVSNGTMDFQLILSPYPGPGTYTLLPFQTNLTPGSFNGTVRISSSSQHSWSLHPPARCNVTIASDTSLNQQAQGKPLHEVKGSLDCPTLAADAGDAAPIKLTQGQFDVYAEMLGG